MKSYQWLVVFFVSLIHLTAFTQRMDVVPFLVDLRDVYHVGYAEVGGLVSAFLLGYALFQIPAGSLADRYSPKLLILIGVLVMLVTSIIFVFVHSLLFALVLRFLMGVSSAMLFSPGIKLISSYTPKRTRGSSLGMMEGGAGMGMLITLTVFPILSVYVHWKILFLSLSFLLLLILFMFIFLPSEEKKEVDPGEKSGRNQKRIPFFQLIKKPVILRLIGIAFFGLFGLYGFLTWLPTYLESVAGFTKQKVGWIMAITMISQIIMGPVSGKVSDWMGQRETTLIIGTAMLAFSSIWLLAFKDFGIYVVVIFIGAGISWSMAPMLALATEVLSEKMEGSVIGIMNTVGQIASAISGYVFGLIFEISGHFQWIWLTCLIVFIIRIMLASKKLEDIQPIKIKSDQASI